MLRSTARTDVLLGLIRNHGDDIESRYRNQLREFLDNGGQPAPQRNNYDSRIEPRYPNLQRRFAGRLRV
ncbi:MAG TPA: hypothetical protein VGO77_26130 [Mycobacterium sp.]|nr:hypothetical protein [Mycobacterium sp.]